MTLTSMSAPEPEDGDHAVGLWMHHMLGETRDEVGKLATLLFLQDAVGPIHSSRTTDQNRLWDAALRANYKLLCQQREKRGGIAAKHAVYVPSRGEPTAP